MSEPADVARQILFGLIAAAVTFGVGKLMGVGLGG
jgi:VIT1/CCC1 family predicted Fe2+/Mn2+ transporter